MPDSEAIGASHRWRGVRGETRLRLGVREYASGLPADRVTKEGAEASDLGALEGAPGWIPGVELPSRAVHRRRHAGTFSTLAVVGEGAFEEPGPIPRQWASVRMPAGSAKGFHIHPPYIPVGVEPADWFPRIFGSLAGEPGPQPPPYSLEQWDVFFVLQGSAEFLLVDERESMPRRRMRFAVDGDDCARGDAYGVVVPAGVAHALRVEGSRDVVLVYGATTPFDPANEGRICSGVEEPGLPPEWARYFYGE